MYNTMYYTVLENEVAASKFDPVDKSWLSYASVGVRRTTYKP